MSPKKAALIGAGAFVAFWVADYFLASTGPARIVVVDKKVQEKRDFLPGNDDVVLPPFLAWILPTVPQVQLHEQIMSVEHGKLPVSQDYYDAVKKGDSLPLRYHLGKFSGLVYSAQLDPGIVRDTILKRKVAEKEGLDAPPAATSPAPTPTPASAGNGISVAEPDAPGAGEFSRAALAARYNASNPSARLKAIIEQTAAVGRNPTNYNAVVTSGDDALDNRITKIRHAAMGGRSDAEKEIQLEMTEAILVASDPVQTPGGRISAVNALRLGQLADTWDVLAAAPPTSSPEARPAVSRDPADRLRVLVPRLRTQLNRNFIPFAQWEQVAAKSDAEQLLKAVSARGRVTDDDVDRLTSDVKKMEKVK